MKARAVWHLAQILAHPTHEYQRHVPRKRVKLLRYKNLLLSERQKLSTGRSLVDLIPSAGELRGDLLDMATYETDTATQIRLHQTDGKLLRAIEGALTRILDEEFSVCEECPQPISSARLEAVP